MCSTPPVIKQNGYKKMPSDLMREAYDLQNHLLWDDLDESLQEKQTLATQSKQVVRYGNKDTLSTEALFGDGVMRLFSLLCLKSKPTIPHRAEIKRHLENVMYALMMKYHPKDVVVWSAEWIEKGLRMGASRPKVDFTLSIGNTAHGLMRRTKGSANHWMQGWVAPKKHEYAEDALVVMKDFMSDVSTAVKSIDQQPNVDENTWSQSSENVNFQHRADEDAFLNVSRGLVASAERNNNRGERNIIDEMGKPTRNGAKLCDNIRCPGITKFGRAFEIYPEMLKKNPDIVLCVKCYVEMIRDGKNVETKSNGIIKYRKPAPRGASKAKMTQVHKGKGAKVLVQYHDFAQSEEATAKQARVITSELRNCPTSFYTPEKEEDEGKHVNDTMSESNSDILDRIEKLETASLAVRTSHGDKEKGQAS